MSNFLDETGLSRLIGKIKDTFVAKANTTAATSVGIDTTPTANSTNLITSGGVSTALGNKQNTIPVITNPSGTTLEPNIFYIWDDVSSDLTLTLGGTVNSSIMNEYMLQITVTSGTPIITINGANKWASTLSYRAGKTYQISVVNGYAVGAEFETQSS